MRLLTLVLLPGCLLMMPLPESAECDADDGASCPGNYACDSIFGGCATDCYENTECKAGFVCDGGECVEPCVDADCGGGFVCEDYNEECKDFCLDDGDCQPGYYCCEGYPEDCDLGDCLRN